MVTRLRHLLLLVVPVLAGAADGPSLGCGCDPGVGSVIDNDGDGSGATIDCDDANPAVHPGAEEHCDGVDEDCDGEVDEDSVDRATFYEDLDGDGWGGETTVEDCEAPDGFVEQAGDCDELDDSIHPGALELCCDEVDQDCDGEMDEGCAGDLVLLGETTEAYAGEVLAAVGDLDGDGFEDLAIGAPDAPEGAHGGRGKVYVFSGGAGLAPGQEILLQDEAEIFAALGDGLGYALTGLGDLDGDGFDDMAMGAPWAGSAGFEDGLVLIAYGPVSGVIGDGFGDGLITGGQDHAGFGWSVAGVGDLTGDGQRDLAVGSPYFDHITDREGIISVFSGAVEWEQSASEAALTITGSQVSRSVGHGLAGPGDHDGDGQADLLFSYEMWDNGGKVGLLGGPAQGSVAIEDVTLYLSTCSTTAELGVALSWAGDVNIDGYDDFVVGAPGDEGGAVYLFHGPITAPGACDQAAVTLSGSVEDGRLGDAVVADLDADGDGWPDLAAGAAQGWRDPCDHGAGAAYLWLGPFEGGYEDDSADRVFVGNGAVEKLGWAMAAADLDGDGLDDLAIGTPGTDVFNENEGAVWIALGGSL